MPKSCIKAEESVWEDHPLTRAYQETTPREYRKGKGQYFTPAALREALLDLIPAGRYQRILDPAAGTGEFLRSAAQRFPRAHLEGWEIDERLVRLARRVIPRAILRTRDALEISLSAFTGDFDLVIGNPPYYEFRPTEEILQKYGEVISGRPNIFALFFQIGLRALKPGGVLAYVVPQSMNNGAYFSGLRRYILREAGLLELRPYTHPNMFHSAQQTVMLIVLKKGVRSKKFVFERAGITIFTPQPEILENAFRGKTTLADLGFSVQTGSIVWNQNRSRLTDNRKGVPLLGAHNIGDGVLNFPVRHKYPQFIRTDSWLTGPAILVNRITGVGVHARLRAAVVPRGMRFVGENHVNVVLPPPPEERLLLPADMDWMKLCTEIADAIRAPATVRIAQAITGNTQISRTELACLLPIDPPPALAIPTKDRAMAMPRAS